jgi:hypothetical protein
MRVRPLQRRRLARTFGAATLALAVAACASAFGLDDVTVADDGGARDATAVADARLPLDAAGHDSDTTADAGPDTSDASDAETDAIADAEAAPDVGPLCGTFQAYPPQLMTTTCIDVIENGGTITNTVAADGTTPALLLSVGAAGGKVGFAFTVHVVRDYVGQVVACNLYGNLVGSANPVPATVIGQITPVAVSDPVPGPVYMHDDAVGTSVTDTSILASSCM